MNDLHPIDFEALSPGDVVTVEQLEMITGHKKGTSAYQHAIQTLRVQILKERKDRPIEIKQVRGSLVMCNASEQLKLARNRSEEARRKLRRTYAILVTTSVVELSDDELKKFDSLLLNTSAKIAATKSSSIKRLISSKKKPPTPALAESIASATP